MYKFKTLREAYDAYVEGAKECGAKDINSFDKFKTTTTRLTEEDILSLRAPPIVIEEVLRSLLAEDENEIFRNALVTMTNMKKAEKQIILN